MLKLRTATAHVQLSLEASVRRISREIGLGVVDALRQQPPREDEEPGRHAERLALGVLRAIDKGFDEEHLQKSLTRAVSSAVEAALAAGLARSPGIQEISEETARAFARGALVELRSELGAGGEGPLTQSLAFSTRQVAKEGAGALATPLVLLAVAAGAGLLTAVFFRLRGN
jgi:hypothetical protein